MAGLPLSLPVFFEHGYPDIYSDALEQHVSVRSTTGHQETP
ncbi:hypothetical protein [Spongiactinospora gelatinilytica]|nr:hypothetical protein [Spongiactinospora gelatinilytica]